MEGHGRPQPAFESVPESPDPRSVLEQMPMGLVLWRVLSHAQRPTDYVIEDVNPAFERMMRSRRQELLGRRVTEGLSALGEDAALWLEALGRVATSGEPAQVELQLRRAGRWLALTLYAPRPGHVAMIALDVTESKHAQQAISAQNREALQHRELQFRVLIENLSSGVALVDAAGRFTLYNRRFLELFGLSQDSDIKNVNSQDWSAWQVHDEHGALLNIDEHPVRKAAATGMPVRNQLVGVLPPGKQELVWMLVGAAPLLADDGSLEHLICTYHDVTERKQIEDALHASEEQLRAAIESLSVERSKLEAIIRTLPIGVGITNLDGTTIMMNEAGLRLHGFASEGEMLASLAQYADQFELLDLEGRPIPVQQWPASKALRGEFVEDYELRLRNVRAGSDHVVAYTVVPVRDGAGQTVLLVYVMQDIGERKQHEAALKAANDRLIEADVRKDEFLAVLSHELRNPLAPIHNSLFILERAVPGGQQAKRAHEVIVRQVSHMTRLIDDLLDVTRISRGKIRLQRERIELCDLVQRTAEDHRVVFATHGVELEVATCAGPLHAEGDPTRLSQVIGNLLSNAAKFTPAGGRVWLSLDREGESALIRVRDNGAGIQADVLEKLFEPFVQADKTLDRSKGGLGLGLSLVKSLVERHGGSVSARSEGPGGGAEFSIRLPLNAASGAARAPGALATERPSALRVLIIEDNHDAAVSLKEALELSGHEVDVAYSGPEGLKSVRRSRPDVVLCDIGLPGMNGYEVAAALRAEPDLRSSVIIALSGYALQEDVDRAKAAAFDRHMAKPPDLPELERVLAEIGSLASKS